MPTPEDQARERIDGLLTQAGWVVQDYAKINLNEGQGIAVRNFPLEQGHGFADYLLYIKRKAAGVVEAKREGHTLTGVEIQSAKYSGGFPPSLPVYVRPLPFLYQSTGVETRFTNELDPEPRSRPVFCFHKPETLAKWLEEARLEEAQPISTDRAALKGEPYKAFPTLRKRLQQLPPLREEGLWPAQKIAIKNLEHSLAQDRPRALIQMATGSGKTFTAITAIYRLIKFAGARRVLFLVDRGNLGDQTLKEFQQYVSPYNNFKFTEEFIVQRLSSNTLDTTARVCISTIQRMFSMLKGKELADEDDEMSVAGLEALVKASGQSRRSSDKARGKRAAELPDRAMSSGATRATPSHGLLQSPIEPIEYNPAIPIETFDVIITDECHRSIFNLWAQVLEYFDAYLIGLTATPSKQTFGFFHQNLVMEYPHEQAVVDGVNVNYDVYRIRTAISEAGSKVDAGFYVEKRGRETRKTRWEQLDDDFAYDPNQLDRDVVAPDQIRTIVKTFRDKLFTDIFSGRTEVPKTLVFAKDDAHAETIVEILREEFAKGNDFAQKITYRTTGANPKDLIKSFRNSYHPRIAVTVDMIATGTDIKPVEIVVFMRAVKSRSFFEQMKGRGVRVIKPDDLKAVTPDATTKDHFVIVDAVGVCEQDKTDARPMEKKPSVSFEKLLQAVSLGNTEEDVLTTIAGRLARMEHRLSATDEQQIIQASGGLTLKDLSHRLVEAVNPDRIVEAASRRLQDWETQQEQAIHYLNPFSPIVVHQANLPHWRQDQVTYFVTFRLADSLPAGKLRDWQEERETWLKNNPKPWSKDQEREYRERFSQNLERWLDQGAGSCVLERPEVKSLVAEALQFFNGTRYVLGKCVVAANHVHVLVTPKEGFELSDILHSWKSYTAKEIVKRETAFGRSGDTARIWQKESYDHIVRSPEELFHIEQYIERHREFDHGEGEKRRDAASTAIQDRVRLELIQDAVKPLHDPKLRELLVTIKKKNEITIDHISQDHIIEAGFSAEALDRAKGIVHSFEQFIQDHKDEITALQVLYSKPYKARLTFDHIKELAQAIERPPYLWNESQLWQAYTALEKSKVKGASAKRILTDLFSLVRFAMHQDNELVPFPEKVQVNFKAWLAQQEASGKTFTEEQNHWLKMIRDHIAANLSINTDDFDYAPFAQNGGLGKVHQVFGDKLNTIIEELNGALAA